MHIKLFILIGFIFICFGCAAHVDNVVDLGAKPSWVYNPSGKDFIGGVGVCGTHIKGKIGQRELAITRALNDIARQIGVTVDTVLQAETRANQEGSSATLSSYSVHTVSGVSVTASIVETWTDPATDELYIYMQVR